MRLFRVLLAGLAALLLTSTPVSAPADAQLLRGIGQGFAGGGVAMSTSLGTLINYDSFLGANAAIGSGTNTTANTLSFWTLGSSSTTNKQTLYGAWMIVADGTSHCEVTAGTSAGVCNTFDSNATRFIFNFNNATGTTDATDSVRFTGNGTGSMAPLNGLWNHVIVTFDTSVAGRWAIYENGVDMRAAGFVTATVFPLNQIYDMNNASGWHLNSMPAGAARGSSSAGWYADLYMDHGYVGCTGVGTPDADCAAANTIAPSRLAKFFSGGLAPDLGSGCNTPTGSVPAVCLKGNGAAMAANTGTATTTFGAGAGFVSAASVGTTRLFPAPYGPGTGIPAHQATLRFIPQDRVISPASTASPATIDTGNQVPLAGDTIVLWGAGVNSATLPTTVWTCPAGFTQIAPPIDTTNFVAAFVCYKVNASGSDLTGSYSISWTNGSFTSSQSFGVAVYANVASVDVAGCQKNTASTTITPPALTTASANETLLNFYWEWTASARTFDPPSLGTIRARRAPISGAQIILADTYAVASGSSTSTGHTIAVSASVTSQTCALSFVPS